MAVLFLPHNFVDNREFKSVIIGWFVSQWQSLLTEFHENLAFCVTNGCLDSKRAARIGRHAGMTGTRTGNRFIRNANKIMRGMF